MIYLCFGNDRDKVLNRSSGLVDKALSDLPDALLVRINVEGFEKAKFEELINGRSLFSKTIIVLCDGLLSNKETSLYLSNKIEDVAVTANSFIFRDGSVDKKTTDSFKKNGAKIE